jgi:hypothetical protein
MSRRIQGHVGPFTGYDMDIEGNDDTVPAEPDHTDHTRVQRKRSTKHPVARALPNVRWLRHLVAGLSEEQCFALMHMVPAWLAKMLKGNKVRPLHTSARAAMAQVMQEMGADTFCLKYSHFIMAMDRARMGAQLLFRQRAQPLARQRKQAQQAKKIRDQAYRYHLAAICRQLPDVLLDPLLCDAATQPEIQRLAGFLSNMVVPGATEFRVRVTVAPGRTPHLHLTVSFFSPMDDGDANRTEVNLPLFQDRFAHEARGDSLWTVQDACEHPHRIHPETGPILQQLRQAGTFQLDLTRTLARAAWQHIRQEGLLDKTLIDDLLPLVRDYLFV